MFAYAPVNYELPLSDGIKINYFGSCFGAFVCLIKRRTFVELFVIQNYGSSSSRFY